MKNKNFRPTTYIVMFWNEDGSEKIGEEIYPMYLYSLDDVIKKLKGREAICVFTRVYWKNIGKYITTGNTYIWDACGWALQL